MGGPQYLVRKLDVGNRFATAGEGRQGRFLLDKNRRSGLHLDTAKHTVSSFHTVC